MWRECRLDRRNRNFIDRQIRRFDDEFEYVWCTNLLSSFICLILGFSIYGIAQQPLNQTFISFGHMYLFCALCNFCIFGLCLIFDN